MKQIRIFPMYSYFFKLAGLGISIFSLIVYFFLNPKFEIFIYTGFLIMAFSREKNENDFVSHNRNEIFKLSFGLFLSFMIALTIVESFFSGFVFNPGPFLYIGLPLVFYLTVFYLSLIFNIAFDSSFKLSENAKKSKLQYLLFLLLILIVFVLLIFISKK